MAISPKPAKVKRIKITELPVDELYQLDKITKSVVDQIRLRGDFSKLVPDYCEKICKIPDCMKDPLKARLYNGPAVDIVIIQDQKPRDSRWKSGMDIERLHQRQINFLARRAFGLDIKVVTLDLVKCQSKENIVKGKHKDPTATQMGICSAYLFSELNRIKPKIIISTSSAITKVLGVKGKANYSNRGEFYYTDTVMLQEQVPVVLTLHVSVLNMIRQNASGKMYGPDYFSVLQRDFTKASALANKQIFIQDIKEKVKDIRIKNIIVPTTLKEVEYWTNQILALPSNFVISWDLETTSLDPWSADARILTCQFGFRRADGDIQSIVFPLWHKDNKYYSADKAWFFVAKLIVSLFRKVGHNIKFDIVFCAVTTGVRAVNADFDTMLMLHSSNSGIQGNYGLKAAVWDYLPETGLGGYDDLLDETLDVDEMKRLIALEKAEFKEYSDDADNLIEEEIDVAHDS